MTMTEPDFAKVATLRGLCLSAFTLITPKPFRLRHKVQSALPRPSVVADFLPSQTAAIFSMQRHVTMNNPTHLDAGIELADWDLLFRAVLETLSRVTFESSASASAVLRLQTPADLAQECLGALDQLRRCVPVAPHLQRLSGSDLSAMGAA